MGTTTPAPLPLLDWTKPVEWRDVVIDAALHRFAPGRDRTWLLSHRHDTRYWNVHDWYEPLRAASGIEEDDDFLRAFAEHIPVLFERIRMVHLCRPLDFGSYRARGIVRLDPAEMQKDLIAFMKSEHPDLADTAIQRAIDRASTRIETREAKVFLALDEREMLEHAGHYAVFGSEYQLVIARELGTVKPDFRQTLRRRGRPAYVVVHLPITWLEGDDLTGLAGDLLCAAISSHHMGLGKLYTTGYGFDIAMDVPPTMIHEIVHAPGAKSSWAK